MDGKEWGGHLLRKFFQGRETMGVRDVSVEGSDINSHHDGVGSKRHGERSYDL